MRKSMIHIITMKRIYLFLLLVLTIAFIIWYPSSVSKSCKDFKSRGDAQQAYESDPIKYKHLDKGGIKGKACEVYKYKK